MKKTLLIVIVGPLEIFIKSLNKNRIKIKVKIYVKKTKKKKKIHMALYEKCWFSGLTTNNINKCNGLTFESS